MRRVAGVHGAGNIGMVRVTQDGRCECHGVGTVAWST